MICIQIDIKHTEKSAKMQKKERRDEKRGVQVNRRGKIHKFGFHTDFTLFNSHVKANQST